MNLRRSFTVIAAAAFAVEASLFSTLASLLPHYQADLGLSGLGAGVLASSYMAGMLVGTVLAGFWLNDRFGVRPTALWGCATLAVASLAFGSVEGIELLDLARVAQGIGAGILWCAVLNWLILVVPVDRRGLAIGRAMGAAVFGTAIGPVLGITAETVGVFVTFAAVALVVFALCLLLAEVPEPIIDPSVHEEASDRLRIRRGGRLNAVVPICFLPPLIGGATLTVGPLDLADGGVSNTMVAMILLIGSLVAAVACPMAGNGADRVGDRPPMIAGGIIGSFALAGMAIFGGPLGLAIGLVSYQGIALSFVWIPLMSLFATRAEAAGVSAAGAAIFLNVTMATGYMLGPLIATGLAEKAGQGATYFALAGISVATTVVMVVSSQFSAARTRSAATGGEVPA
jgi:MFS family permease